MGETRNNLSCKNDKRNNKYLEIEKTMKYLKFFYYTYITMKASWYYTFMY